MGDRLTRDRSRFSDTAETEWEIEPGWDSFDVIESFEIIGQGKNSVKVEYYIYGRMSGHDFICSKKKELVEYKLKTKKE